MASTIRGSNNFDSAWGNGQTWQDVTASRALGTTYTNSTGAPIMLYYGGVCGASNSNITVTIGGVAMYAVAFANNYFSGGNYIIPSGATYSVSASASISTNYWRELR